MKKNSGQTGIALASALVTLGNVSLDQNCRKEEKEKNSMQKLSANSIKITDNNSSYSAGV